VSKELMILNGTGIASIEELIKGPSVRNAVKSIDEEYGENCKTFYRKEKSLICMQELCTRRKFISRSHWITQA
jgi:hypothetical protein